MLRPGGLLPGVFRVVSTFYESSGGHEGVTPIPRGARRCPVDSKAG